MKLYKISFALMLGIGTLSSCDDKLDVTNPNQQTSATFGNTVQELEECINACYNHTRMEGTYARVGYNIDVCRGDEAWNSSQVWYMPFDDLNISTTDEIEQWSWRDWYYTINVCNFVLSRTTDEAIANNEAMKRIKGQALFLRALGYYNLAGYYNNPALITDYNQYSSLDGLFASNVPESGYQYDIVLDQVETDFKEALELLPSKTVGGQWAQGRANKGAAAGFLARTYMMRHKYTEAYSVLKDIISQKDGGKEQYGFYKLMPNYGDNFREGPAFENNDESLYEVQYLDFGKQGTDDEWTPVNTSKDATQGHAIESNFGPGDFGGWADISASPWLYDLFKQEKTINGTLDPRLYWTIGTYENDWEGFEFGNVCYTSPMDPNMPVVTNNNNGGLPIAKNTNLRTGIYDKVVTGLHCGINLRILRYSDVLLRAAECINEIKGPDAEAIGYINLVRERANLKPLDLNDFIGDADKLFEQIANVERPKEFGCEYGRGFDLIRWGFFYDEGRLAQLKDHGSFLKSTDKTTAKNLVTYADVQADPENCKSSYDTYLLGHEFLPIYQGTLNANSNLVGNSANSGSANNETKEYFQSKNWTVRPVVKL